MGKHCVTGHGNTQYVQNLRSNCTWNMMVISVYVVTMASANKSLSKHALIVLWKFLNLTKTLGSVWDK